MLNLLCTCTLLIAMTVPAMAGNRVWIVSTENCPGVDFSTIQGAIDAAEDGDTILVRAGSSGALGPIDIYQKSLTLVAGAVTQLPSVSVIDDLSIRGLLPSQSVTIIGVPRSNGGKAVFADNQGPIGIEDGVFGSIGSTFEPPYYEKIRVVNCQSVSLIRCNWSAPDYSVACAPMDPCLGISGNVGLRVIDSEVNLYDCQSRGSTGSPGNGLGVLEPAGGAGGAGIRLENSTVNLYDTFVLGGTGGIGGQNLPAPFCSDGGDGGPGVFLADTTSRVRTIGSAIAGGPAGPWTGLAPIPNGCTDGIPGLVYDGPGAGMITVLPDIHKVAAFDENVAIREGESVDLTFMAGPEDLIFLGVAGAFNSTFESSLFGTVALQPLTVLTLGNAGNSGTKSVSLSIGDVTNSGEAVSVYLQAYYINSLLQLSLSAPTATSILDSSHDLFDGCPSVFHVDDDAPGDPGPGDPNISDPLEDGSLAHPFDSIQEAIDSIVYFDTKVLLADGTFTTPFSGGFFLGTKRFSIESQNGPENCIIDAGGGATAIEFEDANLTLEHGLKGITFAGASSSAVIVRTIAITIENCIFENNTGQNGSGLRLAGSDSLVTGCLFRAKTTSNRGGGLFITTGSPTIRSCTFINNSALTGGGLTIRNGDPKIQGCTVANNSGGGIELRAGSPLPNPVVIENSIVWGNTGGGQIDLVARDVDIPNGDVQGGLAGIVIISTGSISTGPGFIDADPQFVDAAMGDFHLGAGSPCIDAGDPAFVAQPGETDIDGDDRVQGAAVDLGSDET